MRERDIERWREIERAREEINKKLQTRLEKGFLKMKS